MQNETAQGSCNRCAAGTYQGGSGETACVTCPVGSFCEEGASAALPCEAGSFSAATDLGDELECTDCPAGSFCVAGSTAPINCRRAPSTHRGVR